MADFSASSTDPGVAGIEVPWTRIEGFVAKLTHDVRNGFNALELQVTLIGELADDPEIKEEVKRVRQSLAGLTRQLQAVRVATGAPTTHLFPYPAAGSSLQVGARPGAGTVALCIHQQLSAPPASPAGDWGRTPLLSSRRNVYGLGAFRARRILEAQGGALDYIHSDADGSLVTTITLSTA